MNKMAQLPPLHVLLQMMKHKQRLSTSAEKLLEDTGGGKDQQSEK